MEPDLQEIYCLERENNKMLRSLHRQAWWGWIFKIVVYAVAIGIPIWLYFNYLFPVIHQMDQTLSAVTGKQVQLEGSFAGWAQLYQQFKDNFSGNATSSSAAH
ncbi:MAG: hypothetical protein JO019_00745 [Candidatus Kaiserbacteria bacterium]|nr:hypothetical protein [Candidatus Kaiserbacteria bacterium]